MFSAALMVVVAEKVATVAGHLDLSLNDWLATGGIEKTVARSLAPFGPGPAAGFCARYLAACYQASDMILNQTAPSPPGANDRDGAIVLKN